MIKLIFEDKEYNIGDNFQLSEKNKILDEAIKIIETSYTIDKGFKSKYFADELEKMVNAKILFVDDLDEQETETMVIY